MKKITLFIIAISYQLLAFSYQAKAQLTDLLDFGDTTGVLPAGTPVISGNVLYATTQSGGENGFGTIFSVHINGSGYKVIWNFDGVNGKYPPSSLLLSGNKLYGVGHKGGVQDNDGNVFSIDTDGSGIKDLWDFDDTGSTGNANGVNPQCTLLRIGNRLYGMTQEGGANGVGVIFSINANGGGYKDLWDFDDTGSNGTYPYASLTLAGKKFYGTTYGGGVYGDGNVFSIDTGGGGYKDLFDFNSVNGENPEGNVTVSGNKLYGMTTGGGEGYSMGVIFSMDTDGSDFKEMHQFNDTYGGNPEGSLTLSGNLLYGTTNIGGLYGYQYGGSGNGIIFSIDTNGTGYTDIFDFNTTYGANPQSNLTLAGGTLYGMAPNGGANNAGLVFSDDICNLFTTVSSSSEDTGACSGTATATPAGGPTPYGYRWQDGQTTNTATGLCAGTYTCTITNNNGCTTTASASISGSAGINEVKGESEEVNVYPNPSNGVFTILIRNSELGIRNMEVYNVLGEQVYTSTLPPPNGGGASSIFQMNLSSQPDGIYLYRVITNSGELIGEGKIMVQR